MYSKSFDQASPNTTVVVPRGVHQQKILGAPGMVPTSNSNQAIYWPLEQVGRGPLNDVWFSFFSTGFLEGLSLFIFRDMHGHFHCYHRSSSTRWNEDVPTLVGGLGPRQNISFHPSVGMRIRLAQVSLSALSLSLSLSVTAPAAAAANVRRRLYRHAGQKEVKTWSREPRPADVEDTPGFFFFSLRREKRPI